MSGANENNKIFAALVCVLVCIWSSAGSTQPLFGYRDLADFSIEELANISITTASRREESHLESPAFVFVITQDMIRRSGATTIAEALRLAPGVEVARRGPDTWAISIRGFNNDIANKLLVLIDGRSVYSPLFAGVFWDVQDTLIEDIERIEVVAGPGGTLWGANAVNGVVNIITRSAFDTAGGFVEIGGGSREPGWGGFRYGRQLGTDTAARAYVKYEDNDRDYDDRHRGQAGFRIDWDPRSPDRITVQGDVYRGEKAGLFRPATELGELPGPYVPGAQVIAGHNLLARWARPLGDGFDVRLQFYYDHTRRDIPGTYNERRDTFDVEFLHGFRLARRHEVLWGVDFRHTADDIDNTLFSAFEPASRSDQTWSAFLQDRIELDHRRLYLTLGSKFEHNDYTGGEVQPNARLLWFPDDRQAVWAAVSRAVRIPSRLDTDLVLTAPLPPGAIPDPSIIEPVYVQVTGSRDFDSEELIAYEVGYRAQPRERLSFDATVFYNDYDDIQSQSIAGVFPIEGPPGYTSIPIVLSNAAEGEAWGATLAVNWHPVARWRLQIHHAWLDMRIRPKAGATNVSPLVAEGNSPRHQSALRSYVDLRHGLQLYASLRRIDELPNQGVDSYVAFDLGVRWWLNDDLELSVTGLNLNDPRHVEFEGGYEVERSLHGRVTWRF